MAWPQLRASRKTCLKIQCQRNGHVLRAESARDVRAAATDFRRTRLGLGPAGRPDHGSGTREGVQLTIDTHTDTYEQAVAAVQAA
jgi:hypothetical protein